MALTRAFLKGMDLSEEQVKAIIEAHTETVDALKEQRDSYKEKSEKIDDLKKEVKDLRSKNGDEWQQKYEKEHSDFEAYKTDILNKESKTAKENAYKELLKDAGVDEKRISTVIKVADLTNITLEDGKIKDADKIKDSIKTEWSDFIVTENTQGAQTQTPPVAQVQQKDYEHMTIEEYISARKGN